MPTEIINLVIQVFFLLGAMFFGFWQVLEIISKKIEHAQKNQTMALRLLEDNQKFIEDSYDKKHVRIYERMDEKFTDVEKTFVRTDIHNITINHLEQKMDDKFMSTIRIFELKLDELTREIQKLVKIDERRNGIN